MLMLASILDTLKTRTFLSLNKNTFSKTTWQQIKNKRHKYYLVMFCRQILCSTKPTIYLVELTNLSIQNRHLPARVASKDPTLVKPPPTLFQSQLSTEGQQGEEKVTIVAQRAAIQHIMWKRQSPLNRKWGLTRRWAKTPDTTCDIPRPVNKGPKVANLGKVPRIWMHPIVLMFQRKWLKKHNLKRLRIGRSLGITRTFWLPWRVILAPIRSKIRKKAV